MGQKPSVPFQWSYALAKDDGGNDCAVLYNSDVGTVLELCGSSTGWFSFMDHADGPAQDLPESSHSFSSFSMRGKYCPGIDASFEFRHLTAAPKALPALRAGDGDAMGDGWRLQNWTAMQEDAPLILQCRGNPDLRLVLTGDGFVLFAGAGASAQARGLVARRLMSLSMPPRGHLPIAPPPEQKRGRYANALGTFDARRPDEYRHALRHRLQWHSAAPSARLFKCRCMLARVHARLHVCMSVRAPVRARSAGPEGWQDAPLLPRGPFPPRLVAARALIPWAVVVAAP